MGTYYFSIFYLCSNSDSSQSNPTREHSPNKGPYVDPLKNLEFKEVCQYKIVCHSNLSLQPFPKSNNGINWGSHLLPFGRFKIIPSQTSAILTTRTDRLDLFFRKEEKNVRLMAVLMACGKIIKKTESNFESVGKDNSPTVESSRKNRSICHCHSNSHRCKDAACNLLKNKRNILLSITFPMLGEYLLEIYAHDPDRGTTEFLCRHLIIRRDGGRDGGSTEADRYHLLPIDLDDTKHSCSRERAVNKHHKMSESSRTHSEDDNLSSVNDDDRYNDDDKDSDCGKDIFRVTKQNEREVFQERPPMDHMQLTNDDGCIITEDEREEIEMRSNLVYQSRLKLLLDMGLNADKKPGKRNLYVISGDKLPRRFQGGHYSGCMNGK